VLVVNKNASSNHDAMPGFDVVRKVFWKLTVSDVHHLCERLIKFAVYDLRIPGVRGLGVSLAYLALNPTLQSSPQVTITQRDVRDSSFVQQDHPVHSMDLTYSNYCLFLNLQKFFLWCPLSKQWMTQVCGRSLAGGRDIKRFLTS